MLVIDHAQIFQVKSAIHAKLDTMEMANLVLMLTNAMLEVTLVILEMKRHVVMLAPVLQAACSRYSDSYSF